MVVFVETSDKININQDKDSYFSQGYCFVVWKRDI